MKNFYEINRALAAKKKFYILIAFALLGVTQVWANTAKIEGEQWKDNREWSGPHATFLLDAPEANYDGTFKELDVKADKTNTITWTIDPGCTIEVTAIKFRIGSSSFNNRSLLVNGEAVEKVGFTTGSNYGPYTGYSLGADDSFTFSISKDIDLYYIELTYTITPNKPGALSTEEVINVTIDPENLTANAPQTVNFGIGESFDESVELDVTPNSSNFGHKNGLIYATVAGEYKVKARVAAKETCHEETKWSDEVTITVNRLDQTLSWINEEAINTNMEIGSEQTIAASSTSGRTVTYESTNTDVLTVDENGKLNAIAVGEAKIIVSRGQDDQYNAAESIEKTFNVVRLTPEFAPVDFATEDSCAVRKNEAATINLANVSDGLEGDFTATPGDDKISVSREGNVLTISAHKVGVTTLTLSQKETDVLAEVSKTYKVEVLRLKNKIWVNGVENYAEEMHFNAHHVVEFTSDNTDEEQPEFVVEQLSGAEFATYEDGVIIASYRDGTATWKVSQAQSDNYEATEAIFSMTIKPTPAMTGCNVLEDADQRSWSSQGNSGAYIFAVDAPGAILTFDAEREDICVLGICQGNNTDWHIEYATTLTPSDKDWTDLPDGAIACEHKDQYYEDFQYALPEDARAIRFITANIGSFGKKFIKNVRVSRKTWLEAENVEFNLLPEEAGEGTLTVDYSLADGDELQIVSDNEKFTLDQSSINYESCSGGKVEIPVHFAANAALGTHTANVTIYNAYYSKTVQLIAHVRAIPEIITAPQASDIKLGLTLAASNLSGGEANVEGAFAWEDESIEPESLGDYQYNVVFTPTDQEKYKSVVIEVMVKVTDTATGVESVNAQDKATKVLLNGQVLIRRGGVLYTIDGKRVR